MDTKSTISSFSELSHVVREAINKLPRKRALWWRGHGSFDWQVLPSVFRDSDFARDERALTLTFKDRGEPRTGNPPNDKYRWLFLMQHFGLPTRLLDWTESPAFALWFAVERMTGKEDGALVGLDPYQLNQSQGWGKALQPSRHPPAELLFERAYSRPIDESTKAKIDEATLPHQVVAIRTPHSNIRMMVQHSRFTIHSKGADLQTMAKHNDFLIKVRIPNGPGVRKIFLDDLKLAGITEDTIYPDLEHLAKVLRQNSKDKLL